MKIKRGKIAGRALICGLALTLVYLLVLAIGLRAFPAKLAEKESPEPEQTDQASASVSLPDAAAPASVEDRPSASLAPTPIPTPDLSQYRPIVYDARSYDLVTDMVFAYRRQVQNRDAVIAADVEALKANDERLGTAWGGIMDYWDYANSRMEIHYDALPADLPTDDSLCIVVLGFQLEPDGSMAPELLGRCELGLHALEQYPEAYLLLAGGGTAEDHPELTEAGAMRDWFLAQGVEESRIILEDQSTTTEENAANSLRILTERYPQIKSLAIVSSDYHLPLSCLLFTETALLYECEYGYVPYTVISNLALRGYGLNEYKNPEEQALYVWAVAKPEQNG